MAQIELTHRITTPCIFCNCVPIDESSANNSPLEMLHARGVDVNWGEDANICQICAGVMADLLGRVDAGKYAALQTKYEVVAKKYTALNVKHNEVSARLTRIIDGKRAEKEQVTA